MEVTAELYANFVKNAFLDNIDNIEDNSKCMLLGEEYGFTETDEVVSDISDYEIDDADYERQVVQNVDVTRDSNIINVDCNDINFGDVVTISAHYACIYVEGDTEDESYLMFHIDFAGEQESDNGTFELQIHDDGLFDVVT